MRGIKKDTVSEANTEDMTPEEDTETPTFIRRSLNKKIA
jgi:hypothetical protein